MFQLFLLPGEGRSPDWRDMVLCVFSGSRANFVGKWVCYTYVFSLVENTNA